MKCEYSDNCIFFNDRMDFMPSTSTVYKKMYCMGISHNCARHMIASKLGIERIPSSLYPNNRDMALEVISGGLTHKHGHSV